MAETENKAANDIAVPDVQLALQNIHIPDDNDIYITIHKLETFYKEPTDIKIMQFGSILRPAETTDCKPEKDPNNYITIPVSLTVKCARKHAKYDIDISTKRGGDDKKFALILQDDMDPSSITIHETDMSQPNNQPKKIPENKLKDRVFSYNRTVNLWSLKSIIESLMQGNALGNTYPNYSHMYICTDDKTDAEKLAKSKFTKDLGLKLVSIVLHGKKKKISTDYKTIVACDDGKALQFCIVRQNKTTVYTPNSGWSTTTDYEIQAFANIVVGEHGTAYKKVRNKYVPDDYISAMQITTHDMTWWNGGFITTDCNRIDQNLIAYLREKAPTFLKYSKFEDFIIMNSDKKNSYTQSIEARLSIYMIMLWYFPQTALLVSMGNHHIIQQLANKIAASPNRQEIARAVDELAPLFNDDATEGHKALILPKHVIEYLTAKEASLQLYFAWANLLHALPILYEKASFEQFIYNPLMIRLACSGNETHATTQLFDMYRFGYDNAEKLLNYISSQSCSNRAADAIQTMYDYLTMCDFLDITIDLYPQNLQQAHDNVTKVQRELINERTEKFLDELATECERIASGVNSDKYCVVFPHSTRDLIDEGQQMHNCVGTYYNNIVRGYDIVFFIRRKEEPEKSYVTAEFTTSSQQITQLYKSYNRHVDESEIRTLAKKVANNLKRSSYQKTHAHIPA